MAQFARPSADISNTGWVKSSGSTFYGCIGEETYSDTDSISITYTTGACVIGLSPVLDPESSSGHIVRFRYGNNSEPTVDYGNHLIVSLFQGSTLIATIFDEYISSRTIYTTGSAALTSNQSSSITDYSNLRLKFDVPYCETSVRVSWAEMEIPDAPSGTTHEGEATLSSLSYLRTKKA